ncbi:MAG TPA: hypothetical protein VEU11_05740 [Terriglobales bacterium]|nr:hypothetical protein [Terriglobales bacterium]
MTQEPIPQSKPTGSNMPWEESLRPAPDAPPRLWRLIALFWAAAVLLGLVHAWFGRYFVVSDIISYLDIADAYRLGDWHGAMNAYWSPLFCWLLSFCMLALQPSPYSEFPVVSFLALLIYLATLGCFHFFLSQLLRFYRTRTGDTTTAGEVRLPDWAWVMLGYSLFLWSSAQLIAWEIPPDMCVAAVVYLACGLLLRIRSGPAGWGTFALLGVVLGFGYLAKQAMFPLGFVFLGVSLFCRRAPRNMVKPMLAALGCFALVSAPFIVALSRATGRLTFGEAGRLNYAWHVNRVSIPHWQGGPPGSGKPKHPPRKISDDPPIYEFAAPIRGTYPLWLDPFYWYDGVQLHFDLWQQIRAFYGAALVYYDIFFGAASGLLAGFFILWSLRSGWARPRDAAYLELLIPALAAFGMYSLVHTEERYVGAFVVLLCLGAFSSLQWHASQVSEKCLTRVVIAAVLPILAATLVSTMREERDAAKCCAGNLAWEVASGLEKMGVRPGDRVALIGQGADASWARPARVRIVADTGAWDGYRFWTADPSVRDRAIKTFAGAGAEAIVAEDSNMEALPANWQRIGATNDYVYLLSK